jgi:arylsulfatase B
LREFLDVQGLAENTILIFTTDNGSSCNESIRLNDGGHPGRKGSLEEHGHRVPCFVHWPKGGIDRKREIPALAMHMDWLPTFIELCGLRKPEIEGLPFDGVSLVPLLTGKEKSSDPRWAERMYLLQTRKGTVVMKRRWRLINGRLSNLDGDPQQRDNVAGQHPELVATMEKHWQEVRESVRKTPWQSNRPIYVGETPNERLSFRTPSFYTQGHILAGKRHNATWPVHFLHAGTYELEFRRWAPELDEPLDAAVTVQANPNVVLAGRPVYVNGGGSRGKALAIRAVKLEVGDQIYQGAAEPGAAVITVQIQAEEGPTTVRATFLDGDGKQITTPYYSYARHVHDR